MPVVETITYIVAPIERVFDLARSVELHAKSSAHTGARAIAGLTSGLVGAGQDVTWRARHFGFWFSLTIRITEFARPSHFAGHMQRGAFRRMEHHHHFAPAQDGTTIMCDVLTFESPLGILGRIADALVLERHMRDLLIISNQGIKAAAEGDDWKQYVTGEL